MTFPFWDTFAIWCKGVSNVRGLIDQSLVLNWNAAEEQQKSHKETAKTIYEICEPHGNKIDRDCVDRCVLMAKYGCWTNTCRTDIKGEISILMAKL
jgi:hypothetical protein